MIMNQPTLTRLQRRSRTLATTFPSSSSASNFCLRYGRITYWTKFDKTELSCEIFSFNVDLTNASISDGDLQMHDILRVRLVSE